jgi:hypothetical protein
MAYDKELGFDPDDVNSIVEARRLALAHGVDMKGMLSRRRTFERELKQHAGGGLHERDRAHILAFCVLEPNGRGANDFVVAATTSQKSRSVSKG